MRDTVARWILSRRAISAGVWRPDDTASTISFFCSAVIFGSEDPADPTKTTRVLTIMLAEEY